MAAEIKHTIVGEGARRCPLLVNKIDGNNDEVNAAIFIPREDGVITVSDDRYDSDRCSHMLL